MSDAKSAPFAHIPYVKKNPCIPLEYQKATISANHAKFAYHFSI